MPALTRGALAVAPGLALAMAVALGANALAQWLGAILLRLQGLAPGAAPSPVSGIMVAIVLGLLLRNVVGLPEVFQPGVSVAMKQVLRLGIVLLGIRLSVYDALRIGFWGIPVVALTIATGIGVTTWLNRRLRQPERLGTLIAASTSICGVTAAVSTAPAIGAEDREVTYAVATVTVFGLLAMLLYPYFAHWAFAGDPVKAGLFLGTSIHETSQVAGAALIYAQVFGQPQAVDVATVTKLLRNVFLVVVVPLLSLMYLSRQARGEGARRPGLLQLFPTFVLGFLAMAVVRSLGDAGVLAGGKAFGLWDAAAWRQVYGGLNKLGTDVLLASAMAGVGLNTSLAVFRDLGAGPMVLGLASALTVGIGALGLAATFGPFISM
jgi:uncharacterized integral membrane protein (TIGR00698 family)